MSNEAPQRILLIRLSSIGDIVLTTPLVRLLRQSFPDCQIDFLTKSRFKELVCHHPGISQVLEFPDHGTPHNLASMRKEIRARGYDHILDLHKNLRSLLLTAFLNTAHVRRLKKYGLQRFLLVKLRHNFYRDITPVYKRYIEVASHLCIEDDQQGTELHLPDGLAARIRQQYFADTAHAGQLIAIAPGAGFATKRWPVEQFSTLASKILARGHHCCIVGDRNDRDLAKKICAEHKQCLDLTGKLSLLETAAVLSLSSKVVCNDSGLMHIAEAVGTPVVALFGSTVRELGFFPHRTDSQVIENPKIACRPCSHVGRHHCPRGHFDCMHTLSTEQVVSAVLQTP